MLKKFISIIILIILLPILFVNGVILIDSLLHPNEVPSFFGWKPFIVLSGSMETEIYSGDLAIVKEVPSEEIKLNDIIAYKTNNVVVTHRIINITEEEGIVKYKTKGDNNNIEDTGYVTAEQIEGIYMFKVSGLGNLAIFVQTPIGMVVSLSIPLCLFLLIQMIDSNKTQKQERQARNKEEELYKEIEMLKKQNEELMKK